MISGLSLDVNVACYAIAFAITIVSGFYTYRQRLTAYQLTRDYLVLVYLVILVLMVVDLARVLTGSSALLTVYPLFGFGLGFIEAILLLSAAVGAHLRPSGSTYGLLLKDLRSRPSHLVMFFLFIGGTLAAESYLAAFKPYSVETARDFAGGTVMAVSYSTTFAIGIGMLFVFFLAYPVGLLVVSALRVQSPPMKRAQLGLAIAFAGSSAIYLISSLSLFDYSFDVTGIAYIVLSVLFGMAARNFRRAAVLAGFVTSETQPLVTSPAQAPVIAAAPPADPSPPKALRTRTKEGDLVLLEDGELTLVEVDTATKYEEGLFELVKDFQAERRVVFVVSAKGSRVNSFFSKVPGIKLYTMTESARHIAPSSTNKDEVNIPVFDSNVLLDVFDRTLASAGEPIAIIFDSVSDMMIYSGFQQCYKFLREAAGIVTGKKAVTLFVLFGDAHEERNVTAIKSIFAAQLKLGTEGFEIVR